MGRVHSSLMLLGLSAVAPLAWSQTVSHARASQADYAALLGYLVDSRIDGQVLAGSQGAIAANLAAGDGNVQANLRALAVGEHAQVDVRVLQQQHGNQFDTPTQASASIGGNALAGANGLVSINQASGSNNAELNIVSAALATQGIREASDEALASSGYFASAEGQASTSSSASASGARSVAVESTALRGMEGVLQLNQIAGSGNATGNQLSISVQAIP